MGYIQSIPNSKNYEASKKEGQESKNTSGLVDEEEWVTGGRGERATGESVFSGFLVEIFDVFAAYICSPCLLSLSRGLRSLPHLFAFFVFFFLGFVFVSAIYTNIGEKPF
jgi:hypothetical protein